MLINSHTGAVAYNGTIDQNVKFLHIDGTWVAAKTEINNTTLTVAVTGKVSETIIPALTLKQLADIAAFINVNGFTSDITATKVIDFALPLGLGNAVDLSDSSLTYQIAGATAGNTIKVSAIDGPVSEKNIMSIKTVGTKANAEFALPCVNVKYLFVDPANLTRVKMRYTNGKVIEYSVLELQQLARESNPIALNVSGVVTGGYDALMGIVLDDVVNVDILATAVAIYFTVEEMSIN